MLNYSKINVSKLPSFGKLECVNSKVCPDLSTLSVVWCSDTGVSYSRKIHVSPELSMITPEFECNQTKIVTNIKQLQTKLSETPGKYYVFQLGGSSSSYLLVKVASTVNVDDKNNIIRWNALNFLHRIGWIEYPGAKKDNSHAMGVPKIVKNCFVKWTSNDEIQAKVDSIPEIDIHWVWFRRADYKLKQEIVERAYSWIALNQKCRFHLWTDIPTSQDFDDFMSNVEPEWRANFIKNTTVHFKDETNRLIDNAFDKFEIDKFEIDNIENTNSGASNGIKLLRDEFDSLEKQSRIYKTDIVRLLILGTLGGIYVDFNDCICIHPIREIIALYGYDTPLGVSDHYDVNHASNYFLYCPPSPSAGNLEWNKIVSDMIEHIPHAVALIRNMSLCETVRSYVNRTIKSLSNTNVETMDVTELQTLYEKQQLPYCGNERLDVNMWNRFIWVMVGAIASASACSNDIRVKIQPRMEYSKNPRRSRGSNRPPFIVIDDSSINVMIDYIADDTTFNELFLFWWTDYNLRVLMHYTNLPIFCRMRKTPLVMLPFGYLLTYSCALSWIGHIGDGTSYGMDGRKDGIRMRNYLEA